MAVLSYALCTLAALLCTVLLVRGYIQTRTRLLLWSAICFACLTLNNVLIIVDLVVFPDIDLFNWRTIAALAGVCALLFGLIWEGKR